MKFELERADTVEQIDVQVNRLLIAGFTARNRETVLAHLEEVKHLGVQLPDRIPALYPSIAARLTQAICIQVPTPATSGEAEVVFIQHGDRLLVALGSDHTERSSEGVALIPSKSVCDKPISLRVWDAEDILDHIEDLELHAEISENGNWRTYQRGSLRHFIPLLEMLEEARRRAGWSTGDVLMCGTLPTVGSGLVYANGYRMRLSDPRTQRTLHLDYEVELIEVDRDGAFDGEA